MKHLSSIFVYSLPKPKCNMLSDYLNLQFDVNGKAFKGFCMRIHDDFHVTYAVILENCHSFCVWLDEKSDKWYYSKYTILDKQVLDQIIGEINVLNTAH